MSRVYSVQYQSVSNDGGWRDIGAVVDDKLDFAGTSSPIRSFLLYDKSVVEFPANQFIFKYSREREERNVQTTEAVN